MQKFLKKVVETPMKSHACFVGFRAYIAGNSPHFVVMLVAKDSALLFIYKPFQS